MRRSELQARDFKVASKEIAILRLRYLQAFLKTRGPEDLNMAKWCGKSEGFVTNGIPECGTPFCFGGWILALFAPAGVHIPGIPSPRPLITSFAAAALIGIDPNCFSIHARARITMLFSGMHSFARDPKDEALGRVKEALRLVRAR